MTGSVTINHRASDGSRKSRTADYTGPSSYATGGDPITPQDFGLDYLHSINAQASGKYMLQPDYVNNKLKVIDSTTGNEVASTTNLSAVSWRLEVRGK